MEYRKTFNLKATEANLKQHQTATRKSKGDRRDGEIYLYNEEIELTVNVALATGRPVLLRGPSGSGKSSLAKNVALRLGRRYYEEVITSKTQHTDLQWRFDLLRRFRDASVNKLKEDAYYIEPRAFWWAFDRDSAARRGLPQACENPAADLSETSGRDAVVLIDEIDKADPDVPNNLLVTLGSLQFTVSYLNDLRIEAKASPLVFLTSNDERDLPGAFLRRCVTLELKPLAPERLVEIAAMHFGDSTVGRKRYKSVAEALYPATPGEDPATSTAEYLDAVRACIDLKVRPEAGNQVWETIMRTTVRKAGTAGSPGA
jgi:MoxR-like ATPase